MLAVAELFAGFGSGWLLDAVAVFVIVPFWVRMTLIATNALFPLFSVPRLQVTFPAACVQLPCDAAE